MEKIILIYGTDTGTTEHVIDTYIIDQLELYNYDYDLVEVSEIVPSVWELNNFFILGIPTWYDGELQSDWEDYFETFRKAKENC